MDKNGLIQEVLSKRRMQEFGYKAFIRHPAAYIAKLIPANENRFKHILGVVRKVNEVLVKIPQLSPEFVRICEQTAYLHDIGYASKIAGTGFHPFDGFHFLKNYNFDYRICLGVLYHSFSDREAHHRRMDLVDVYEQHPLHDDDLTLLRDIISYADIRTSPTGDEVTVDQRYDEIQLRYGTDSDVYQHMLNIRGEIDRCTERIERLWV